MNKVILYIATSLDCFIADDKGGVDWLPQPETSNDLEVVGYNRLIERVDAIIMGSRSYQQIITFGDWGWSDKDTYVFTSKPKESEFDYIEFIDMTPSAFMEKFRDRQLNKDIWLLGGAQLAHSFANADLIDEIILTIIPKKLGSGVALNLSLDTFCLNEEKPLMNGMVQQTYLRNSR